MPHEARQDKFFPIIESEKGKKKKPRTTFLEAVAAGLIKAKSEEDSQETQETKTAKFAKRVEEDEVIRALDQDVPGFRRRRLRKKRLN